jgi:hypothetical protein
MSEEHQKHDFWTYEYRPFVMGGSVWQPMVTELECIGPFDLGKGYEGYFAVDPSTGITLVCESQSCGIVGNFIEQVAKDIAEGDDEVMKKQVYDAILKYQGARRVAPEEFWKKLRHAK